MVCVGGLTQPLLLSAVAATELGLAHPLRLLQQLLLAAFAMLMQLLSLLLMMWQQPGPVPAAEDGCPINNTFLVSLLAA